MVLELKKILGSRFLDSHFHIETFTFIYLPSTIRIKIFSSDVFTSQFPWVPEITL